MRTIVRWKWLICIVLGALGLSLIPVVNIQIVPAWSVVLKDETSRPVQDAAVKEVWNHYSLEVLGGEHYETAVSDESGRITFPERSIRVSIFQMIAARVRDILARVSPHASSGPFAYVVCQEQHMSCSESFVAGAPQPTVVEVRR